MCKVNYGVIDIFSVCIKACCVKCKVYTWKCRTMTIWELSCTQWKKKDKRRSDIKIPALIIVMITVTTVLPSPLLRYNSDKIQQRYEMGRRASEGWTQTLLLADGQQLSKQGKWSISDIFIVIKCQKHQRSMEKHGEADWSDCRVIKVKVLLLHYVYFCKMNLYLQKIRWS